MGRSVSVPQHAAVVVYAHFERDAEDDWAWDDFTQDLTAALKRAFPSLLDCSDWIGREDHGVLRNNHAHVTLSEYCGLIAVCLVPRGYDYDDPTVLAHNWCAVVEDKFRAVVAETAPGPVLKRIATASNGEAFFERVQV